MSGRRRASASVTGSLRPGSSLRSDVRPGLGAMKVADRRRIDPAARDRFVDSIDVDEALRLGHPVERRWDYVLGDEEGTQLVGVEPRPAESGEVAVVMQKKRNTERWLVDHLRGGGRVARWLWVGTGKTSLPLGDKVRLRLAQAGIRFVGRRLQEKHLD